jgi:DNA-binding transcriptional LysR family regulator
LRAFLLTAENGSASVAARSLGVTQPAISQQLQELERLLQVRLIERVGIRMLPTSAGRALVDPVRRALAAIDQIEPTVAPFRDRDAGLVRLGTGATACIHFLPAPLALTQAQLPNLQILVVTGNSGEILASIEDGAIDVGLVTGEVSRSNPAIHIEPVFEEELVAVLPRPLEYQLPGQLTPQDLGRHPLILFDPAGTTRSIIDTWFKAAGIRPIPAMELGSIEAIKTLVGAGLGVSVIPSLAARSLPANVISRPLVQPARRHLALALRADKILDAGLRALLAEIRSAAEALSRPAQEKVTS